MKWFSSLHIIVFGFQKCCWYSLLPSFLGKAPSREMWQSWYNGSFGAHILWNLSFNENFFFLEAFKMVPFNPCQEAGRGWLSTKLMATTHLNPIILYQFRTLFSLKIFSWINQSQGFSSLWFSGRTREIFFFLKYFWGLSSPSLHCFQDQTLGE